MCLRDNKRTEQRAISGGNTEGNGHVVDDSSINSQCVKSSINSVSKVASTNSGITSVLKVSKGFTVRFYCTLRSLPLNR